VDQEKPLVHDLLVPIEDNLKKRKLKLKEHYFFVFN